MSGHPLEPRPVVQHPATLSALHHRWDVLLGHRSAHHGVGKFEAFTGIGLVHHAQLGLGWLVKGGWVVGWFLVRPYLDVHFSVSNL